MFVDKIAGVDVDVDVQKLDDLVADCIQRTILSENNINKVIVLNSNNDALAISFYCKLNTKLRHDSWYLGVNEGFEIILSNKMGYTLFQQVNKIHTILETLNKSWQIMEIMYCKSQGRS